VVFRVADFAAVCQQKKADENSGVSSSCIARARCIMKLETFWIPFDLSVLSSICSQALEKA